MGKYNRVSSPHSASLVLRQYSHLLPSFIAIYQGALPGFTASLHHAHAPSFCSGVCIEVDLMSTKPMSPVMFGAAFEEINHAGEGGLYPELLCDRSFDAFAYHNNRSKSDTQRLALAQNSGSDPAPPASRSSSALQMESLDPTGFASMPLKDKDAWQVSGTATLSHLTRPPAAASGFTAARKGGNAVRLSASGHAQLVNTGHTLAGFALRAGTAYNLTMTVRAPEGPVKGLLVLLTSADGGTVYCKSKFTADSAFATHTIILTSNTGDRGSRFVIRFQGPGVLDLDYVSLIQADHFSDRGELQPFDANILQMLKDLKPRFLRFPGGAYLEGVDMSSAYRWKDTLGPPQDRPGHPNSVWGYWSTDGFGLHEMLMLCEALGAQPVLVLNVGMSQTESLPPDLLQPWIQDGLDAIEYITGADTTTWGALRAAAGKAAPWPLSYVALGNEACLRPWYKQHYTRFSTVLRAAHPHLKLLANCDLGEGADFDMWEFHTYRPTGGGLRVCCDEGGGETLAAAIAEAAFMCALERNCDKVLMAAYAPLLSHIKLRTWVPDLIAFEATDSGKLYGTPSYYVQQLFSRFQGESCALQKVWYGKAADNQTANLVESSTTCLDKGCERVATKVVNFSDQEQDVTVYFSRATMERPLQLRDAGKRISLRGLGPNDVNSLELPQRVAPKTELVDTGQLTHLRVAPYSLTVLALDFE
ncbi:MAG: hypothetical protein WDW36_001679 [Sanguina aurantia]